MRVRVLYAAHAHAPSRVGVRSLSLSLYLPLSGEQGGHDLILWRTEASLLSGSSWHVWELPVFVVLGAGCGLLGAAFVELNKRLTIVRKRFFSRRPRARVVEVRFPVLGPRDAFARQGWRLCVVVCEALEPTSREPDRRCASQPTQPPLARSCVISRVSSGGALDLAGSLDLPLASRRAAHVH
jgi:hypothetical protein